jgi:CHAT domain-containing protein/Tfp pilus assembly protein PilF
MQNNKLYWHMHRLTHLLRCARVGLLGKFVSVMSVAIFVTTHVAHVAQASRDRPSVGQGVSDVRQLVSDKPIERVLSGDQSHSYRLSLNAGQYLHLEVFQQGIDVVVTLFGPGERKVTEVDSPNGTQGPETIFYVTDTRGEYRLEVRSLEKTAAPGRYVVRIAELRQSTSRDVQYMTAETTLIEARRLGAEGTAESSKKALERYQVALTAFRSFGKRARESEILGEVGSIYSELSEWKKALEVFDQALSIRRAMADRAGEASTLHNIGRVYNSLGDWEKALDYYTKSLPLTREVGNRPGEAITLTNIGTVYLTIGEMRKALGFLHESLKISREIGDHYSEAVTLNNIGGAHRELGEQHKALEFLELALRLRRVVGDKPGEASTLHNIGLAYDMLGDKQRALDHLNRALSLRQLVGDREGEASTLGSLALIYDLTGDKQKALSLYNKALQMSHDIGNKYNEALTLSNTGLVYISLGDNQKALDFFNRALPVAREVGDRRGEAYTLNHIGRVYDLLGDRRKALEFFKDALPIIRETSNPTGEAYTLHNIAYVYDSLGQKQEAINYYSQALEIVRTTGDRFAEAFIIHNLGVVYDSLDDRQKALSYYNQSLQMTRSVGDRLGEAKTLYTLGRIKEREGNHEGAIELYLKSLGVRESVRSSATIEEIKTGLASEAFAAYEHAILLLQHTGQSIQAFELTERARARTLLDQVGNIRPKIDRRVSLQLINKEQRLNSEIDLLENRIRYERSRPISAANPEAINAIAAELAAKQREYEDLWIRLKLSNSEYSSLRSVAPLMLAQIQRLLDSETTLLSYFVTAEKTLAFIITRRTFKVVELRVKETELEAALNQFRAFDNLAETHPEALRRLYGWLVAPLSGELSTRVIGIVPHGLLHYLPFAALTDGQEYFGDEKTLYTVPSASLLRFIGQKRKASSNELLALSQSRAEGLPLLQYADAEVKSVAALYKTKPLIGKAATESVFRRRADKFNILHIAAHAQLNPLSPLFSRIVLSPSPKDDGLLEVRDIYNLDLERVSLVVLSACDTELGPRSRGDDIVGLNRAFIYAGSPTIIASLWSVDDEATGNLMMSFYRQLRQGKSKAVALQLAQRDVRAKKQHPYYWAAFVLTGATGK